MSSSDLEQVRSSARNLLNRLQTDSAFAEQVKQNPSATLTTAGLPEQHIEDFLHDTYSDEFEYCRPLGSCVVSFVSCSG